MAKQSEIEAALVLMARPGVTSKQLRNEIAKAFPKASKKDLRLAAFSAMIAIADRDPEEALQIQDYALTANADPDSE